MVKVCLGKGTRMKYKRILIILVPIIIILVIMGIFLVVYATTDLFKSDSDLFWKYAGQVSEALKSLDNTNIREQQQSLQNSSYSATGKISYEQQQGTDSLKVLNIDTSLRHDNVTKRTYADATLKNGDIDLFTLSYINSGDIYAIKCKEVVDNYVGMRNSGLQELARKHGISNAESIPDSINFEEYATLLNITEEQKQHILETYLPVIQSVLSETNYQKSEEQITIQEVNYQTNKYQLEISGEQWKQILLNCLNTLKADNETLLLLSSKFSMLDLGTEYTEIANLTNKIEEWISEIEKATSTDNLILCVYESEGQLVRASLEVPNIITIAYDNVANHPQITITLIQSGATMVVEENEVIDVTTASNSIVSTITLEKVVEENKETNKITILPNAESKEQNIEIEFDASKEQEGNTSNTLNINVNTLMNNQPNTITIQYDVNVSKEEQVEEIQELTNANTVIANNYEADVFNAFMDSWWTGVTEKIVEKMETIGFEIEV